jgi:hypothetical protein
MPNVDPMRMLGHQHRLTRHADFPEAALPKNMGMSVWGRAVRHGLADVIYNGAAP